MDWLMIKIDLWHYDIVYKNTKKRKKSFRYNWESTPQKKLKKNRHEAFNLVAKLTIINQC